MKDSYQKSCHPLLKKKKSCPSRDAYYQFKCFVILLLKVLVAYI